VSAPQPRLQRQECSHGSPRSSRHRLHQRSASRCTSPASEARSVIDAAARVDTLQSRCKSRDHPEPLLGLRHPVRARRSRRRLESVDRAAAGTKSSLQLPVHADVVIHSSKFEPGPGYPGPRPCGPKSPAEQGNDSAVRVGDGAVSESTGKASPGRCTEIRASRNNSQRPHLICQSSPRLGQRGPGRP
jgi:hypothetical protein